MDIRGACVVAKSPLLRIHGNALFLTEVKTGCGLDSKHFLLARGKEATSLYSDIKVGSCYDVDHVTPTTITKGTDGPRKILLLSASSKINPCNKDVDPIETNIPTLECTVSNCFDKTLGIYELEENNRLYLTYQYDGKSHLPSIPIGSKVIVHNAHRIHVSDRESELGSFDSIVCCMRTSVNVKSLSKQQQQSIKEKSGNVQRVLLPLCGKLFPSLSVLEWLRHQAIPTLLQKLVPSILKLKDMLPVLVQLLTSKMTSNDLPIIEEKKRNPYEDFLSHDKACHLVQSCGHISKNVPCTFLKVGDLGDFIAPSLGDSNISSLNQLGWTCRMLRSCDVPIPMVLVTKLCCNGTDGRLFLSDATGSIPCTLAKIMPLKKHTKDSHKPDNKERTEVEDMVPESSSKTCCESYDGERTEIKDDDESRLSTSSCFPQPCLNHLLRIDDFVVILENKSSSHAESSSEAQVPLDAASQSSKGHSSGSSKEMRGNQVGNQGQSSKVIMYVMFNPRNVTCLHRGTERAASPGCMRPRRRKRSSTNSEGSLPESTSITKTFLLRTRRQLLQERRDSNKAGSTKPSFYCDILILDSDHPPKKSKNDAIQRHGEGDGEKGEDEGARKQEERLKGGKAALLCFHGDAVRWYNFLHDGEVYKMDCKHTDMQAHVVPSIMKLAKKGMTQPVYIITSYSQLQILLDSTHHHIHQTMNVASSADVYRTNKGKHGQRLSSISGLITRKTIRSSSIEEAHTSREDPIALSRSSIHLELEDVTTHTTASVSVPTHIHEDNLGLVPGASVSFRNCLMKIDPGSAVTYDIGPLTSIQVENLCTESFRNIASTPNPQHSAQQAIDATSHMTLRQRSFLYHMMQDTSRESSQVSWVYAHVSAITKLILRWICKNCGRNDCKCAASGRQDGKIITQILLAVDDGTGECLIWSNRPTVVSAALGLSPREWTVLEDSCTGPNKELVYHKWAKGRKEEYDWEAGSGSGPRRSRLVLAVSKLCQHWTVQCSLWFKTRYFRESTKEIPSDSDKSAWPAGLVLCCEEVSL